MTYAYKKSEHNEVAHSLFGNFEMDSSVNNELRKVVTPCGESTACPES